MRGDISTAIQSLGVAYETNPNHSIVKGWFGFASSLIGDWERMALVGQRSQKLSALAQMGDFESADKLADEIRTLPGNRVFEVQSVSNYLVLRDKASSVVEIVNENYGDLDLLFEDLPVAAFFGTQYIGSLAYAYRQAGMAGETRSILKEMRSTLDTQKARGSDSWIHWYSEAQYAALSGDANVAIDHLQAAIDRGWIAAVIADPVFDTIRDDERFAAIEEVALARANRERRELGLGSYQPPVIFD